MRAADDPWDRDTDDDSSDRRRQRGWTESPRLSVVLYTAAFVIAEAIGAFVSLEIQALLDGILAFVALNYAIFGYRNQRTTGMVMAVLFSTRLFTVVLPFVGISVPTRAALVGVAGAFAVWLATWVLTHDVRSTRAGEGFALKPPIVSIRFTTALVAVSGIPIGWLAWLFLEPDELVTTPVFGLQAPAWAVAMGCLALGALAEELIYRRLVAAMVQHTAMSQTPWISAVLFAATYFGTQDGAFIALTFFTGAWFAWSCERTGSIRGPVIAHATASILAYGILPG